MRAAATTNKGDMNLKTHSHQGEETISIPAQVYQI